MNALANMQAQSKVSISTCIRIHQSTTARAHLFVIELSEDNRLLQESNKALSLYMNKILRKIVENQDLVDVLNIDDDDDEQPQQQPKAVRDTTTSTSVSTTSTAVVESTAETCKKAMPPAKKDEQANHSSFRLSGSHWTTPIKWVASRARAESLSKLM